MEFRPLPGLAPGVVMRFRNLTVSALFGLASCSSKPVDCNQVAPSDCPRYSECYTVRAGRVDEQCVQQSYPLACWPPDHPSCEMEFSVQDPNGQCWLIGNCVIPQGWQEGDATCDQSLRANFAACYPQDGRVVSDGGIAYGGGQ